MHFFLMEATIMILCIHVKYLNVNILLWIPTYLTIPGHTLWEGLPLSDK